jgi:hypothetical protein
VVTPADHAKDLANTVREALPYYNRYEHEPLCQSFYDRPLPCNCRVQKTKEARAAFDALLDALLAQAETAEAERDRLQQILTTRTFSTTESGSDLIARLEAERDAAVRERDQAQDALRWIANGRWNVGAAKDTDIRTFARAALAAREDAWTHEDRMVLGDGGC